jgi:hypothetical protein
MGVAPERVDELARAAARRVVAHLEGERLIPRFIDSYVMGFDRPQLKQPAEEFLRRSNQLGREALALLGVLTAEKCAAEFHWFKLGPLRLRDAVAAQRFVTAFWRAVVENLKLPSAAAEEVNRQADSYRDAGARPALFRERIAPLLDPQPQMKDKAEHAGNKFFEALDQVAAQVATRLFERSS